MLMIQIAAAVLLVLGSGLIFRALLEIDAPSFRGRASAAAAGSGREVGRDNPSHPVAFGAGPAVGDLAKIPRRSIRRLKQGDSSP